MAVPAGPRPAGVSDHFTAIFPRYPLSWPACAIGRMVFSSSGSAYPMAAIRYPPIRTITSQICCSNSCSLTASASAWLHALSACSDRLSRRSSLLMEDLSHWIQPGGRSRALQEWIHCADHSPPGNSARHWGQSPKVPHAGIFPVSCKLGEPHLAHSFATVYRGSYRPDPQILMVPHSNVAQFATLELGLESINNRALYRTWCSALGTQDSRLRTQDFFPPAIPAIPKDKSQMHSKCRECAPSAGSSAHRSP